MWQDKLATTLMPISQNLHVTTKASDLACCLSLLPPFFTALPTDEHASPRPVAPPGGKGRHFPDPAF